MVHFVRLTLLVAACLALLFVLAFIIKLLVAAAFLAAVLLAGLFLYNFAAALRRRARRPVLRR
ncbi:MAG: hypothetical protein ACLPYS_08580 [Vulcanimicrobiaceae bacterium]